MATDRYDEETALVGGKSAGAAVPRAAKTTKPNMLRVVVSLAAATAMALVSATPNAFNTLSKAVMTDTGMSSLTLALLLGLGVAGLQFTLPAGILLDRFGPVWTTVVGLVAVSGGYLAMSYSDNVVLILIFYSIAALGSGTTFLSALSTAIGMGYPIGIAAVSLTMSLSISFTVLVDKIVGAYQDCDEDYCWREYVRAYSGLCGAVFLVGALGLSLRPKPQPEGQSLEDVAASGVDDGAHAGTSGIDGGADSGPDVAGSDRVSTASLSVDRPSFRAGAARARSMDRPMSLWESSRIFRKPVFLAVFFANTIGLGSGILVITSAEQMWEEYNTDHTKNHWNQLITVYFSMFSGGFNVISPLLSDYLHRKGYMRRSRYLATTLLLCGADFIVLGIMTIIPHQHHGACHLKMAFVFLMACVGAGFGTYLTLLPTLLEDVFGMANWGAFMSYMQLGSTAFAVAVPTITSGINSAFHSYNSLYWGTGALLLLASACLGIPAVHTATFGSAARRDSADKAFQKLDSSP